MVLSRKNKKEGLGRRLWNSITEPIPDDDSTEQDNEQIPLAYDLKDSAASKADEAEAKSTVNIPRSTANSGAEKQPVDAVIEPEKVAKKAHQSEAGSQAVKQSATPVKHGATSAVKPKESAGSQSSSKAASAHTTKKSAATQPTSAASQAVSKTASAASSQAVSDQRSRHAASTTASAAQSAPARAAKKASQATSTAVSDQKRAAKTAASTKANQSAATSEVPMTRMARRASQEAASQAKSHGQQSSTSTSSAAAAASAVAQSSAPKSAAPKSAAPKSAASSATNAKSTATTAKDSQATAAKQPKVERRIPADHIPPVARKQQPRIAVKGTEQADDDTQPELPLSREELYGDQQPNGGKQPNKASMSRVARHEERRVPHDDQPDDDRDFSELETDEKNPHLKKPSRRYNWKLMLTGVAILVVAAGGAFFMWNHGQATQAAARTNAEKIVDQVYTSSAQRDLRASASSSTLTELQNNIDNMKDSSEKTRLQKQHDTAAKMLTVRTSYQDLRNAKGLLKTDVTMDTITKGQQRLTTAGLTSSKPYFAKKYDKLFTTTGKTVKKVVSYDAAFQKLYNKKNKLKASTPSTTVGKVLANLKAYRNKSQLAANDYQKLITDRKKLAKANNASSSISSSSSYSYSEPESSSSSSYSTYSESSDDSSSSSTYSYSNDTDTSSATSSSSTPSYSYSANTDSSSTTNYGETSSTTTGGTASSTDGYSTTTSNN
ncbi:hypothetical protein [Lactiplantibacillus argentoratensis]|uniref:hypothetical protein n=1 Tax=Lactiplantibacillus argentoratensis TaxID=271881 RepID=UPI001B339A75|nr:hypothetical protein [Lactiplantibacillus argentoratensis]